MLRLAHRILSQKKGAKLWGHSDLPRYRERCADAKRLHETAYSGLMERCPTIIVDNVREYVMANEVYALAWDKYPPMPPPFKKFFIESNVPRYATTTNPETGEVEPTRYTQDGMFCTVLRGEAARHAVADIPEDSDVNFAERTEWFYEGVRYLTIQGTAVIVGLWSLALDAEAKHVAAWAACLSHVNFPSQVDLFMATVKMALAFMQCKNVEYVDASSEGPIPKWCRRQRLPQLRYRTLMIDPSLGKKKQGERKTEGDRSGKALHIVRGHFAHYKDDGESNGLFGRGQFGTFWVPSHARGSIEQGQVVSQYGVKIPDAE